MQPALPKISIVIPSYNQGQFIEETFLSIIAQHYEPLEIIVIDGGSTDHTVELIKRYQQHITYWVSEKDSGQSEAINKGFKVATGEIVTWLNSDDYYEPHTLHKVSSDFLQDPKLSILHGKALLFGQGLKNKVIGLDHDISLHDYLPYMRFPQPSSFMRKASLDRVLPVSNSLHYAMDFELIVRLLLTGNKIKRSDELFSGYRMHPSSKSNDHLAFLKEWSHVVGILFHTLSNGTRYLDAMKELGLIQGEIDKTYPSIMHFSEKEVESIFLQHINICYHSYYRAFKKKETNKISQYIKKNFPAFYKDNYYKKYNNRLKFIPKFVFHLTRAIG